MPPLESFVHDEITSSCFTVDDSCSSLLMWSDTQDLWTCWCSQSSSSIIDRIPPEPSSFDDISILSDDDITYQTNNNSPDILQRRALSFDGHKDAYNKQIHNRGSSYFGQRCRSSSHDCGASALGRVSSFKMSWTPHQGDTTYDDSATSSTISIDSSEFDTALIDPFLFGEKERTKKMSMSASSRRRESSKGKGQKHKEKSSLVDVIEMEAVKLSRQAASFLANPSDPDKEMVVPSTTVSEVTHSAVDLSRSVASWFSTASTESSASHFAA